MKSKCDTCIHRNVCGLYDYDADVESCSDYQDKTRTFCLPVPMREPIYRIVKKSTGRRSSSRSHSYVQKEPHDFYYIRCVELTEQNAFEVARNWGKTIFKTFEEAQTAKAKLEAAL